MTISIVLCLADNLISAGIEALLRNREGLKVVDVRPGARSALGAVKSHCPDVVLGDRNLAESTEVEEIAQLCKIIVIDSNQDPRAGMRWVDREISAVLGEDATPDALFAAVHVIANVSYLVVPSTFALRSTPPAEHLSTGAPFPESPLSQREAEVLRLLADGKSNVGIAKKLGVHDPLPRPSHAAETRRWQPDASGQPRVPDRAAVPRTGLARLSMACGSLNPATSRHAPREDARRRMMRDCGHEPDGRSAGGAARGAITSSRTSPELERGVNEASNRTVCENSG